LSRLFGGYRKDDPVESEASTQKHVETPLPDPRIDMALTRTTMAAERTLMAWVRTAISMIGFGFTIYKFFQYLPEEIASGKVGRPDAPRNLGMTLIALGTLALTAAAWEYRHYLNQLGATQKRHIWSIAFVVAVFVILIGAISFYGVLLRSGPF
jgi:putative membrane protein